MNNELIELLIKASDAVYETDRELSIAINEAITPLQQAGPSKLHDELIHVGFTNAHQVEYGKEESGSFYPNTDGECYIPLYMLKRHQNRLGPDYMESAAAQPTTKACPVCGEGALEEKIRASNPPLNFSVCSACGSEQADAEQLSANKQATQPAQAQVPNDPLDTKLPCDVKIGSGTFRKGVPLRTLVKAAEQWQATAASQQARPMSEREAFEDWQHSGGLKRPDDAGEWDAWQARAAFEQPAQAQVPEDWPALNEIIQDYVDGYELRGDDGDYTPNDKEKFLIEDCVAGLIDELGIKPSMLTASPAPEHIPDAGKMVELKPIQKAAMALYKPPFTFEHGYIFDADRDLVADDGAPGELTGLLAARIRGWGRIQYLKEFQPEDLQDTVGELIVEALNDYWMLRQQEEAER